MKYICPYCEEFITTSKFEEIVQCNGCKHVFDRKKLFDNYRIYVLKKIADLEKDNELYHTDFKFVQWYTANDQHVCLHCKERQNKIFTFEEIKNIITTNFCQPNDLEQGCRCVILATKDPNEPKIKSKQNSNIKVISKIEDVCKNGEIVKKIVFDLEIQTIKIQCPKCGKKFKVFKKYEHRKAKCICGFIFRTKNLESFEKK